MQEVLHVVAIEQSTQTGVSFALTDEQKELRQLARGFATKEIRPLEREYDEKMQHPVDVIAKAHETGLMNPHVPEEYGGAGLSAFDGMLIGEELYWGCSDNSESGKPTQPINQMPMKITSKNYRD